MCLQFFFYLSQIVMVKKWILFNGSKQRRKKANRKPHPTIEWDGDEKKLNPKRPVIGLTVDQRPRENIILYINIIIRSICANVWQHLARGDPGQCAVGLPWCGGVQIKDHAAYHTAGVSAGVYITIITIVITIIY